MTRELSIFIDESGSDNLRDRCYLISLVLHDQSDSIDESIAHYERALHDKGLPSVPFHAEPLMNGHNAYEGLSLETRAKLFTSFRVFFRHLPIRYAILTFKMREYSGSGEVSEAMRKALIDLMFGHIEFLQVFDLVKIYYDGGQASIKRAIRAAVQHVLAKDVVVYRSANASEYRLSQAADYICCLESAAIRFAEHRTTATDEKFFGGWSRFKKGPLKELRKMRLQ